MKRVFVVINPDDSSNPLCGVFSSGRRADNAVNKLLQDSPDAVFEIWPATIDDELNRGAERRVK